MRITVEIENKTPYFVIKYSDVEWDMIKRQYEKMGMRKTVLQEPRLDDFEIYEANDQFNEIVKKAAIKAGIITAGNEMDAIEFWYIVFYNVDRELVFNTSVLRIVPKNGVVKLYFKVSEPLFGEIMKKLGIFFREFYSLLLNQDKKIRYTYEVI
jgi:hypothetical protein